MLIREESAENRERRESDLYVSLHPFPFCAFPPTVSRRPFRSCLRFCTGTCNCRALGGAWLQTTVRMFLSSRGRSYQAVFGNSNRSARKLVYRFRLMSLVGRRCNDRHKLSRSFDGMRLFFSRDFRFIGNVIGWSNFRFPFLSPWISVLKAVPRLYVTRTSCS